ncbi:flagellar export chaperone FliS [Chitinimonas sp. BJYL2]|uniref:flagellar export chaperone FliS n=1 Tax=Chitinimonas sp. BJYL2 TaxID=2976696 RepID=UPI0022B47657|nr:flagellar export chaperone FliS [Chitinimonas sp. BJYL2]
MAANIKQALNAYGQSSLELDVENASPHKLIVMLYAGAIKALTQARVHMRNGEVGPKGVAISRAIAIVEEGLRSSLDREQGGELVDNLSALYDYIGFRLLEANLKMDEAAIEEVQVLLQQLKEAWESIDKPQQSEIKPEVEAPQSARTPLSYGRV